VLWVGQFDLVISLGIPGQFTHPRFLSASEHVLAACRRYDKVAAVLVTSVEEVRAMLAQGFVCLAYCVDIWLYQAALAQGINALRELRAGYSAAPSK